MIRGPVARLTRSEVSAQSMRTWLPSKETVPSEDRTETGTGGPGSRYALVGSLGIWSSISARRISSATYSATPARSTSTASRYGSAGAGRRPPVACSNGSAPSRSRIRSRPRLRSGSKTTPATASRGTATSPYVCRNKGTERWSPGVILTVVPSKAQVPSRWMISAIRKFSQPGQHGGPRFTRADQTCPAGVVCRRAQFAVIAGDFSGVLRGGLDRAVGPAARSCGQRVTRVVGRQASDVAVQEARHGADGGEPYGAHEGGCT